MDGEARGRRAKVARDYGKYVGALLLFGSNGIVASGIALPSSSVVLLRTLLGSLLLAALLVAAKRRITFHRHLGDLCCLAASGAALGASWLFLFEAYRHLGVGTASLVYYCGPIIVAALSPWLFGERLTRAKLAGFGLVLVGVLLVNGRALGEGASGWGLFCGGMSAVMYAAMVVFTKKVRHVEGLESSAVQLASSFAAVALFVGATGGTSLQIGAADWAPLLVLGLVNTGFGCFVYFSAMGKLPAQTVSVCGYLEPLAAVVLSALLLGEAFSPAQAAGVALVIGGAVYAECGARLHLPHVRRARGAEAAL